MADSVRVLHVDDDPDFADLTGTFLERESDQFDIDTAYSAADGFEQLTHNQYECVISDYDMPGQDGIDFLETVRDEYPNLPFILFTGKGSEEIASDAISAGVTDYLQKESGTEQYALLANRILNAVERLDYQTKIAELHRVAMDFESLSTVEAVCERTVDAALNLLPFDDAAVSLYDSTDDVFETIAAENILFDLPHSVPADDSLAGETLKQDQTLATTDLQNLTIDLDRVPRQSVLSTPVGEHGVLQAGIDTPDPLDDATIELAELLASHAAQAITNIKRTEELKHQRDRFQSLFERLPEPIALVSGNDQVNSTISNVNAAFEDVFGFDEEEVIDKQLNDVIVPPDRMEEAQQLDRQNAAGNLSPTEVRRQTADGELRDFLLLTTQLEESTTGGELESFAIYADITEQKETERRFETEQARFNSLFEHLPEPAVVTHIQETESIIQRVNPAFEETFGYNPEVAVESSLPELIAPPDSDAEVNDHIQQATDGKLVDKEVVRQTASGDHRDFLFYGLPSTNHEESIERILLFIDVTDRNQRRHELEDLRTQLEIALEATNAGMWAWDLETDEVERHPSLERLLGLTPGELGTDLYSFDERIDPEHRERYNERYYEAVASGDEFEIECRMKRGDGSWMWIREQGQVLTDDTGTPTQVIGASTDITEQKQREEKFTALHDVTQEMINADSIEEIGDHAVRAAKNILGIEWAIVNQYDPETNQLNPVAYTDEFEAIQADIRPIAPGDAVIWRAFDTKTVEFHTDVHTDSDVQNEESVIRGQIVFPLGNHGTLTCASTMVGGVTQTDKQLGRILAQAVETALDRIEREHDLTRQRDRLEVLFETLPEPTVLVRGNETPTLIDANPAFEEVFQYDAEEIKGENLNELIVPVDEVENAKRIDTRGQQGEIFTEEVQRETADGERRDFLLIASGRWNESQADVPEGFVIYADITERKESERELQRQNERLDEFASMVSHDLRNPLTIAEGHLELLQEECESDSLDDLEQAHDRMRELIEDVLTWARQGRRVTEFERVDLWALIDECWRTVASENATLNINVEQPIKANESRMRQLLENLLNNAVEHGGNDVTIRIGELSDGFYVEDDGPGIPENNREEVFERGVSTDQHGTGFGLAIVQEIVDAHDWTIEVTANDSGGARFEITGIDVGSIVC